MSNPKLKERIYTAEFVVLFISLLVPLGWSMSGLPSSIELACLCWSISLVVLLHYFWISTKRWNTGIRYTVMVVIPVLIIYFSWKPIVAQYRIEHSGDVEKRVHWVIRVINVVPHWTVPNSPPFRLAYKVIFHVNGKTFALPTYAALIQDRFPPPEDFEIVENPPFRINFEADIYNTDFDQADASLVNPYKRLIGEDQTIQANQVPTLRTNELVQTATKTQGAWTTFDLVYEITNY